MSFIAYIEQRWEFDGLSAMCIYGTLKGDLPPFNYPHDPDDICRCLQMFRLIGCVDKIEQQRKLNVVAETYNSEQYRELAKNWIELLNIFEMEWHTQLAPKTYDFMNKFQKIARKKEELREL